MFCLESLGKCEITTYGRLLYSPTTLSEIVAELITLLGQDVSSDVL